MLEKPKRALCIILGLCTAAFFIIFLFGKNSPVSYAVDEAFTVTQRFYGVDAAEMERIAAIPLEDALSGIRGLRRIASSSENGRTRVRCFFEGREKGRYEAIREAAQLVYESLPSAAQRPEIASSSDSRVPVWTAAVTSGTQADTRTGTILEKSVKPALEGLPGAGDVEISGAGLLEIVITLKRGEAAARKIDAADIAAVLAQNDVLLPGGHLRNFRHQDDREIPIMVDGRFGFDDKTFNSMEDLRRALIPVGDNSGGRTLVRLEDIAEISEQERNFESRSRLDGRTAALIAVTGSDGADLGKLSAQIKEELAKFPDLEFTILSDRGDEERKALSSVLGAALQGSLMVALLCALICFRSRQFSTWPLAVICSLTVPVVIFFSAALLILLGFPLDKLTLAGIAVGVGAAVDAAILCAEYFRSCKTLEEGARAMKTLRFPLASGSITTVIALLPLMIQKAQGINSVAWSIAAVNIIAMLLALTLLPPLFLWNTEEYQEETTEVHGVKKRERKRKKGEEGEGSLGLSISPFLLKTPNSLRETPWFIFFLIFRATRVFRRFLAQLIWFLLRKPAFVVACWLLLGVAGITALCLNGADAEQESSEDSVYAQIEFDGGLHTEEIDGLLAVYAAAVKNHPGVVSVQTVARTGTGSALTGFDPNIVSSGEVRDLMRNSSVPGGFVYVMESSGDERNWRIKISGDEGKRCREIAAEAARICAELSDRKNGSAYGILETVLNFKEGSPRLTLHPDRERLAMNGLSFGSAGQIVRRGVHGPVAYKRISGNGETDVRIRGTVEPKNKEEVLDILITGETPFALGSVVSAEQGREAGSIQREDRRRSASISIRTAAIDPRRVRDRVMASLSEIELPPGYTIEFDPEAIKTAGKVSAQGIVFVFALLFCYMALAAFKESFTFPLAVLAVVPPSLAIPAFCISLRGYPLNSVSAAAFVAVCGLAVNAAALVADALQHEKPGVFSWYRVFRRRLPVLLATTITTIAGAAPFLFLKSNTALVVKTISLISALGVAVSALCAVTLIPALAALFPQILQPLHNKSKLQEVSMEK